MVMALYGTLASSQALPELATLERCFDGNLCRCTGYRPLLDAAKTFASDFTEYQKLGANKTTETWPLQPGHTRSCSHDKKTSLYGKPNKWAAWDSDKHRLKFPEELMGYQRRPIVLAVRSQTTETAIFRPTSLHDFLRLQSLLPQAAVFFGTTDFSIKRQDDRSWICANRVRELSEITSCSTSIKVGSAVTMTDFLEATAAAVANESIRITREQVLRCFTPQVRNGSSMLCALNAPDMSPIFVTTGALVVLARLKDAACCVHEEVPYADLLEQGDGHIFRGLASGQVIQGVIFKQLPAGSQAFSFKQGQRRENSPGLCSAAAVLRLKLPTPGGEQEVEEFKFAVSLPAATAVRCTNLEAAIVGKAWRDTTVKSALPVLASELAARLALAKERPEYCGSLLCGFLLSLLSEAGSAGSSLPRDITSGVQDFKLNREVPLQTTLGMSCCEGTGYAEQPGAKTKMLEAGAEAKYASKIHPFHLIQLPSDEPHQVLESGADSFRRGPSEKMFSSRREPLGDPVMHQAAYPQCTGEAVYVNDIPTPSGCLFAALVTSQAPCAKLTKVDPSRALALLQRDGHRIARVHDYIDIHNVKNYPTKGKRFRTNPEDHKAFSFGFVTCVGHVVGMVSADTPELALKAAKLVDLEYSQDHKYLPPVLAKEVFTIKDAQAKEEVLKPLREELLQTLDAMTASEVLKEYAAELQGDVLSLSDAAGEEEARQALKAHYSSKWSQLFPFDHKIVSGDVEAALESCRSTGAVVEGEFSLGGQEHWYLEPHALLAVPGEFGEMTIHTTTQCVQKTQRVVASCLGVPCSKVVVKVKRMGGGFGGKETLSTYMAPGITTLAARAKRPVRIALSREQDMQISGKRHPFLFKYKAGFSKTGILEVMDVELSNNGGNTNEITREVMDRALFHAVNAYNVQCAFRAKGYCYKSNIPSNTAFRGFGATQVMLMTETIMEHASKVLQIDHLDLVERNLIQSGMRLPYGQIVPRSPLKEMWKKLQADAALSERSEAVKAFNRSHALKKRGLAAVPTMYGINFPVAWLNQGTALVHVYTDGTVLVSHGGTEMGQGLNTKMIQIAAQCFGIPVEHVHVAESASDKCANSPPTAASVGSDIHGMAVLNACEKIKARMAPFKAKHPDWDFHQLCEAAWFEAIDMEATGFYSTPKGAAYDFDLQTDDNAERGEVYNYYCFGVAAAEVELDVLTGEYSVERADVIMDVGETLSAAIDIGQVEGAFVQGMGLFTTEELVWGDSEHPWLPQGILHNAGPHYGIPTAADIPKDFRVQLYADSPNEFAVHSSRAVGEPPTFLSGSVYFAVKDAISAYREGAGLSGFFLLDAPATYERVRMACRDEITRLFVPDGEFQAKASV
eukprot:TRINITY_DN23695_c0_g1_i1.p1 TRINITY_DN23695_c0_g1~~TRINITY_DN23695_c0_g1_i1.p1  ORF type:complete len:1513 (-),score=324.42 TRINITY_DN23695_c0_g1_i1:62-4153(-)